MRGSTGQPTSRRNIKERSDGQYANGPSAGMEPNRRRSRCVWRRADRAARGDLVPQVVLAQRLHVADEELEPERVVRAVEQALERRRVAREAPGVLLGVAAALPRAGDRPRLDAPALDAHQHLGRGADQRDLRKLQQNHVRARVDEPQRAVEQERRRAGTRGEAAREHYLAAAGKTTNLPERNYLTLRAARLGPAAG